MLGSIAAGDSSLCLVFLIGHFFRSSSCIIPFHLMPFSVRIQKRTALHQCLRMGVDCADIFQGSFRQTGEYMLATNDLFSDDHMVIFGKQIVVILNNTGCGIFNGKNGIICMSLANLFHGVFPGVYMETGNSITKEGLHSGKTVSTLHTLIDNGHILVL